jgi:hypothetical protein
MLPAGMARGRLGVPSFESRRDWTTKRYAEKEDSAETKVTTTDQTSPYMLG